jgi:hypothetical protein
MIFRYEPADSRSESDQGQQEGPPSGKAIGWLVVVFILMVVVTIVNHGSDFADRSSAATPAATTTAPPLPTSAPLQLQEAPCYSSASYTGTARAGCSARS